MAKFKMIALTSPVAGKEEAFHAWYQNTHLPELVAFSQVIGAQRYQLAVKLVGSDTNPWLAIYDIECDDPGELLKAMGEAASSGKLTPSDSSDTATMYTALFSEYGERVDT